MQLRLLFSTTSGSLTPPSANYSAKCEGHRTNCPWWPYSNSRDFKANAALILIILFSALICALALNAAIRYLLRRRRRLTADDDRAQTAGQVSVVVLEQSEQPKPALVSTAAQIAGRPPTLVFSACPGTTLTECTICLSEFVEGEGIRVLARCNHGFHVECIQEWLSLHSSCPTCRSSSTCVLPP
ncbi:hypothetical protein RJ639_012501 [Escallonia herrerae]|uniref:RING-type E3 ubiquitin transferase n=1 Tax=Escallonia herrerae TaxID=1293975 RepID=A0AA88VN43_9ASTE|nr:hypothetical protein RJ639_012501 [Escallonia herrerae]